MMRVTRMTKVMKVTRATLTRVMRATRVTRLRGEQGCNRVEQGAMKCDRVLRECHRV